MRIMILGNSGSGKSTLARTLGQITGIEIIHLDAFYWQAGWTPTSGEKWVQTVEAFVQRPSWIMDGNYLSTLPMRIRQADIIIYLDFPRRVCYWRIIKRLLKYRFSERPDIAPGCPEKIDRDFISWIWNFPSKIKPRLFRQIHTGNLPKQFYHLKSKAEINRFIDHRVASQW